MFLSQVQGPDSEDDFTRGCAEILLPGLAELQVTVAPWTDGHDFYLHGFYDANPAPLIAQVAERARWRVQTLVLRNLRDLINLPGGAFIDCQMPFNTHAITGGEPYRTCPTGHRIIDRHQVTNCPVCSRVLA
jgi:hypothetical protein